MIWDSNNLSIALDVYVPPGITAGAVKFNSLDIEQGDIFIALPGKLDSNLFAKDAIDRGAACVIAAKNISNIEKKYLIKVDNTILALNNLAKYKRKKSKAKFIAITGSIGKTTTREIIKTMLSAYSRVYASRENFNNNLGLAITLASMPDDIKYAVIELGMNAAGELRHLVEVLSPHIVMITVVSESHIEFFDSIQSIADAKSEIFGTAENHAEVAIINLDMDQYQRCLTNIKKISIEELITFGKDEQADIRFNSYELLEDGLVRLGFIVKSVEYEFIINNISEHLAFNFAAGFAVLEALGLDIEKSINKIRDFRPLMGRGKLVTVKNNNITFKVICDYYNASPQSVQASLEYLEQFDHDSKIAVLGDMGELGNKAEELHLSLAPYIINSGISRLFLIGNLIKILSNHLPNNIDVKSYQNIDEMIDDNNNILKENDILLIKGSRATKLEKLAESLGVKDVL